MAINVKLKENSLLNSEKHTFINIATGQLSSKSLRHIRQNINKIELIFISDIELEIINVKFTNIPKIINSEHVTYFGETAQFIVQNLNCNWFIEKYEHI